MPRVRVEKGDPPTPVPILAESIVKISEALDELRKSGLNEKAIVVLLNDATKVGKGDIRTILSAMRQLKAWYCR